MKIRIVGTNERGDTQEYLRLSDLYCAEKVFEGLTYDPCSQWLNWTLEVYNEEEKEYELVDWHFSPTAEAE